MDVSQKLKEYEGTPAFDMLMNLILVANNGRKGTLLEFSSIRDPKAQESMMIVMDHYIKQLGLLKKLDFSVDNRFFVYKDPTINLPKDDSEIGEFLGFLCVGHNYANDSIPRISGHIIEEKTQMTLYTEICEIQKISRQELSKHLAVMASRFNQIMSKLGLNYHFTYSVKEIRSWKMFVEPELYTNMSFVEENIDTYINILQNMYYGDTMLNNKGGILYYFELFVYVMDHLGDGTWDYLYSQVKPGSQDYYHFQREIGHIEKYISNNHVDPRDYDKIYGNLFR